jgi:hypothetical protein
MHSVLRSPLRWPAAALLLVVAAVHVQMVPEHLEEAPYVGVLFLALSAVSVALAAVLTRWDTPVVWVATGGVMLLALVAFLASRTVGLPQLGDDVGNWSEPLGFPALAAETMAIAVAAAVLSHRTTPHATKGTS